MKKVRFTCTVEAEIEVSDAATVESDDEFQHDHLFEKATDGNGTTGMQIMDYPTDIYVISVEQIENEG